MANEVEAAGAPAAGEQSPIGVDSEGGNMTLDEVAGSFLRAMEDAESQPEPDGEQVSEEGEGEDGFEQPESEPETEDDSGDEPDPDPEPETESSDDDDVLRELQPNAAKKARKRIDKLTARAKEAEEKLQERDLELQEFKSRLESLESGKGKPADDGPQTFSTRVKQVESAEQLQQLYETAKQARKWARENLHEDEVDVGGQTLGRRDITRILNEAEEAIETALPARFQYIQAKQNAEQNAVETFPGWKDRDSDDGKRLQTIWNDPGPAGEMLRSMPNGKFVAGVILEGIKSLEAKKAGKGKPQEQAKSKKPAIAQRVPGVGDAVAPSNSQRPSQSLEERFKGKELSQDDLVALFAEKERARSKQR